MFKLLQILFLCLCFLLITSCDQDFFSNNGQKNIKKDHNKTKVEEKIKKDENKTKVEEKVKKDENKTKVEEKVKKDENKTKVEEKVKKDENKTIEKKTEIKKILPVKVNIEITNVDNEPITPDDIQITKIKAGNLEEKIPFNKKELLPGKYLLFISKKGYYTIKKEFEILSNKDFSLKQALEIKKRKVVLTYENKPDEMSLNGEKLENKEFLAIPGKKYVLTAKKKGSEDFKKEFELPFDEKAYNITVEFNSSSQNYRIVITYKMLPTEMSKPEITITKDGKVVSEKLQGEIEPGKYTVKINKKGYKEYKKEIEIKSGKDEFIIPVELTPVPVKIKLIIIADNKPVFECDKIVVGGKEIKQEDSVPPGNTSLEIYKKGYKVFKTNINIPPGQEIFQYMVRLEKIFIQTEISFIDAEGKEIFPKATLNKKTAYQKNMKLSPGKYSLEATLKGYKNLKKEFSLTEEKEIFKIQYKMDSEVKQSEKAQLDYIVLSNFPGPKAYKVKPEIIKIDNKEYKIGKLYAPGTYEIFIKLSGYYEVKEKFEIPKGKKLVKIEKKLTPKEREIDFRINTNFTEMPEIKPDKVIIDGINYKGKVKPGNREIKIFKKGFSPITAKKFIDIGEKPFIFIAQTTILNRKVKLNFKDKIKDLTPYIVKINAKKVVPPIISILPGKYKLEASLKGYKILKKEIKVEPGEETLELNFVMEKEASKKVEVKPRKLIIKVFSDAVPTQEIKADMMTVKGRPYFQSFMAKPGKYDIFVIKKAHMMFKKSFDIPAGEGDFIYKATLESVPRQVNAYYIYDGKNDNKPPYPVVSLIYKKNKQKTSFEKEKVKPGQYEVKVEKVRKGYEFAGPKELLIKAETKAFDLELKFKKVDSSQKPVEKKPEEKKPVEKKPEEKKPVEKKPEEKKPVEKKVKKRLLSINAINPKTKRFVTPFKTIINGKETNKDEILLEVNKIYNITVEFNKYATFRKTIILKDEKGPLMLPVSLKSLKGHTFTTIKEKTTLDDIDYGYEFYFKNQKLEDRFIKVNQVGRQYHFHITIPKDIVYITIYSGYIYEEKRIKGSKQPINYLSRIDVYKLTKHLESIKKKLGSEKCFEVYQDVINRYFSRLKTYLKEKEKDHLFGYAEKFYFNKPILIEKQRRLIQKLEEIF